jgi:putative FmdB family regulatory protein
VIGPGTASEGRHSANAARRRYHVGRWRAASWCSLPQEKSMPIFEYTCQDCGHAFEALVRSSTVPECPRCHSNQLEKQLSVVGKVGASAGRVAAPVAAGPCGTCGSPGGPGSCALN